MLPSTLQGLWVLSTLYHCWGFGHRVSPSMKKHCVSSKLLNPSSLPSHQETPLAGMYVSTISATSDKPARRDAMGMSLLSTVCLRKPCFLSTQHVSWDHSKVSLLQDGQGCKLEWGLSSFHAPCCLSLWAPLKTSCPLLRERCLGSLFITLFPNPHSPGLASCSFGVSPWLWFFHVLQGRLEGAF